MIHVPAYRKDNKHRIADVLTAGFLIFSWLYAIYNVPKLPETMPIHFDLDGTPNGWGSKYTIFLIPGIFTAVIALVHWIAANPQWHNYPSSYHSAALSTEKKEKMQQASSGMLIILRTVIAALCAFLVLEIVQGASMKKLPYQGWELPLILASIFIPIIFYVIRMNRIYKS